MPLRRALLVLALLGAPLVWGVPGASAQTTPTLVAQIDSSGGNATWNLTANATITVSNIGVAPALVSLVVDPTDVTVSASPAGQSPVVPGRPVAFTVTFGVTNATPAGDHRVVMRAQDTASNATSNDVVYVVHVFQAPPEPEKESANATAPPPQENATAPAASPPPPRQDPAPEGPPAAVEGAPQDDAPVTEGAAPAPARDEAPPPAPRPPESPRQLGVDPTLLVLAPHGSGTLTVVETDLVPVTLALPAGFASTLLSREGGVYSFRVDALPGAVENATLAARAQAGNATAPFAVRVEPPVRVLAASAPPVLAARPPSLAPWAIAAALAGAAGLALAWARRRWPLAFAALYHRLAPSKLLEHPTRARMVEAIGQEPGVSMRELQRRLGLARGVFDHHLHRLVVAGQVRIVADGQRRRLYVAAQGAAPGAPPLPERVVALVHERGRVSASALARELGVSRQALHYHLKRLAAAGRLHGRTEGRELMLWTPGSQAGGSGGAAP